MSNSNILLKGLNKFVDERNIKKVRLIFDEFHPSDVYKKIKNWPIEKKVLLLRLLKEEDASDLFSEMSSKQQEDVINALTSTEISEIFEEMYTDEAVDILEDLPLKITRRILQVANKETRTKINSILRYDKFQSGYHMVVEYISLPNNINIKQAKKLITHQVNNDDLEIVGNVYIYDHKTDEFIGYLKAEDIIANNDEEKIEQYIERITPVVSTDHINEAKDSIDQYDLLAVPVVNKSGKLVGVIEADDIIERYEEAEEAVFEQSAVKAINKPYLDITVIETFKSRIPWIIALLIIGTLTQIIILIFQSIWVSQGMDNNSTDPGLGSLSSGIFALAIMTAMSMSSSINSAAGNSGSQTSSTLVRAIALGEIYKGNYFKAITKEFLTSICIAVTVMIVSFIRIIVVWAIFGEFGGYGEPIASAEWVWYMMLIASIASFSFFITILIGNFLGTILPIIADKFKIDGAIFSGPVQTTMVDIISILVYFSITTLIFVLLAQAGVLDNI